MIEVEIVDVPVCKPCPFCGIMPEIKHDNWLLTDYIKSIFCPECGYGVLRTVKPFKDCDRELIEAFNRTDDSIVKEG